MGLKNTVEVGLDTNAIFGIMDRLGSLQLGRSMERIVKPVA